MTFLTRSQELSLDKVREGTFYLINLNEIQNSEAEEAKSFLNPRAIDRATKFIFLENQNKRLVIHALLRHYLGGFLKKKTSDIELLYDSYGKPYIEGIPIHFNISHTDQFAALAFHPHLPIGIDIEQIRNAPDFLKMSDLFMHQKERIKMLNSKNPLDYFFTLWCAKEAFLKAVGIAFDQLPSYCLNVDSNDDSNQFISKEYEVYIYNNKVKLHKLAVCIYKGQGQL